MFQLEVHFTEPLIVYEKHLEVHAFVAQGCSACVLVLSTVHAIVTSWKYLKLCSRDCSMLQIDDPLDAIAVHAFNGTWGVWAVGLFGAKNLINTSYGYNPYTTGDRHYGCFMGGGGNLLAAQVVYSIWLGGMLHV